MMGIIFRLALLLMLILVGAGCVSNRSFDEGIASFRAEDYRRAFIRLKPEAIKGQPDAQYAVGYMYYYGKGVVENRKEAWGWINRAAEQGQPEAIQAVRILKNNRG